MWILLPPQGLRPVLGAPVQEKSTGSGGLAQYQSEKCHRRPGPPVRRHRSQPRPGGKPLGSEPTRRPHSRLHCAQKPFNMRQLKEMPLAVSSTMRFAPRSGCGCAPPARRQAVHRRPGSHAGRALLPRRGLPLKTLFSLSSALISCPNPPPPCPSSRPSSPSPRPDGYRHLPPQVLWRQLHRVPELRAGDPPESRRSRLPYRRSRSRVGRAGTRPQLAKFRAALRAAGAVAPHQLARLHPHPPPRGPQPDRPAHRRLRARIRQGRHHRAQPGRQPLRPAHD